MPAHLPVVLGLGLSLGVGTAIYVNREKIKDFVEAKKRELEHELMAINDEIQRALNPDIDIEMTQRPQGPPPRYARRPQQAPVNSSSSSVRSDPFSDTNYIRPTNVSESEDEEEEDDLYHSFARSSSGEHELRNRKQGATGKEELKSETHTEDGSTTESGFMSFVDVDVADYDSRHSDNDSSTEGANTPTASEAGDYVRARAFA